MIPYDNTPRIGWGFLSLPDDHPFLPAARLHDQQYTDIINGTCEYTLKECDRQLLKNMLRIAAREGWRLKDPGETAKLCREAWLFYWLVRAWAKFIRPNLEAYRPKSKENKC